MPQTAQRCINVQTTRNGVSLEIGKFCTLRALFNQLRCVTD